MEINTSNLENRSVQDYLSIGYLLLLVMGVVKEAIFYGFLGVSIIKYSSISDVLLSPIEDLTNNIFLPIALLLLIGIMFSIGFGLKKMHEKYRTSPSYQKFFDVEKRDKYYKEQEKQEDKASAIIFLVALFIFSFYIGTGIGGGSSLSRKIAKGDFKLHHQLVFDDGETQKVLLIGHNSQYVFYVEPDKKEVSISPIVGNIKKIERIKRTNKWKKIFGTKEEKSN